MSARCEAGWLAHLVELGDSHNWSGSDLIRACHREAVTTVTSGCVHEHVETWHVCAPCAKAVAARASRHLPQCPACSRDHRCPVLLSLGQLAEAVGR